MNVGFASRRVLVLALCIGSVALAGLMFPVTGIGDVPSLGPGPGGPATTGSTPDTGGSGTPGGPATPTPRPTDDAPTDATGTAGAAADGQTGTPSGTGTPAGTETQSSDATPAATPTPPTATPTPASGGAADDGDAGLLALLGVSLWWLLAAAAIVVLPGVALEGKHRRWPVFRRLPIPAVSVFSLGRSVPQATTALLVDVSGSAARLATGLGTALAGTSRGVAVVTSGLARGIGGLAVSLPGALAGGLPSLSGLSLWSGSTTTLGGDTDTSTASTGSADPTEPTEEAAPPSTVEEAWVAMVERLPVGNWRTKTPMELAGAAVDSGLPAEPVHALTEAFRDVAYGGVTPSEERTERALAALERVRQALEGEK